MGNALVFDRSPSYSLIKRTNNIFYSSIINILFSSSLKTPDQCSRATILVEYGQTHFNYQPPRNDNMILPSLSTNNNNGSTDTAITIESNGNNNNRNNHSNNSSSSGNLIASLPHQNQRQSWYCMKCNQWKPPRYSIYLFVYLFIE